MALKGPVRASEQKPAPDDSGDGPRRPAGAVAVCAFYAVGAMGPAGRSTAAAAAAVGSAGPTGALAAASDAPAAYEGRRLGRTSPRGLGLWLDASAGLDVDAPGHH